MVFVNGAPFKTAEDRGCVESGRVLDGAAGVDEEK